MLNLAWSFPTNPRYDYIIHHLRRWREFDYIDTSIKSPIPYLSEMSLDAIKNDKICVEQIQCMFQAKSLIKYNSPR
jgi:hypothetical protein